jgi:ubiquitin fusion degradation protein 1
MPTSALDRLSRLNVYYPMMFSVRPFRSPQGAPIRPTHCGVLEFSAPEGIVYLPPWMLKTLGMSGTSGGLVRLRNVALPLGTFIKIQPQSTNFLDITDPRAVLEHSLRSYACLTLNDIISIRYNETTYNVKVLEVIPETGQYGISIMETDLQVDFAPPVGYIEKDYKIASSQLSSASSSSIVRP